MSRPKEYYYPDIKKWLMRRQELPKGRLQVAILENAVNEALKETRSLPNGELRIKAIQEILFDKTKTYEGVAMEVNYDWRTVQNWTISFVNLVGKKAGY